MSSASVVKVPPQPTRKCGPCCAVSGALADYNQCGAARVIAAQHTHGVFGGRGRGHGDRVSCGS